MYTYSCGYQFLWGARLLDTQKVAPPEKQKRIINRKKQKLTIKKRQLKSVNKMHHPRVDIKIYKDTHTHRYTTKHPQTGSYVCCRWVTCVAGG
jgi:hypothetical protein